MFPNKTIPNWILWVANFWGIKIWDPVEDSSADSMSAITVRMDYLFAFQFWYCEGEAKSIVLVIFVLWQFFDHQWWGVLGLARKYYLGPAIITSFSSWEFSRSNLHFTFRPVALTGYFYFLFLWTIAVSDFPPLEIYKNVVPPLSTITFPVNSHADNHSCKCICLFQIWYSMKSVFLIKIHDKVLTKVLFKLI